RTARHADQGQRGRPRFGEDRHEPARRTRHRHRRARQRADGAARRRRADRQLHPPGRGAAMVTSRLLLPSLLATALAACTVGPDFVRPEVAVPESFIQAPTTAAGSETGVVPEADAAFWQRFGDPQLTALVEHAL